MLHSLSFLQPRRRMQFLFLASHGLRSNLSALRWASGRLLKSSGNQSKEQKHLAQEIYDHTRILTTAFNAMLILGRLEEKELEMKKKELLLLPLLESLRADVQAKPLEWVIECDPHIRLFHDEHLMQALFSNLILFCTEAAQIPGRVMIYVHEQAPDVLVYFYSQWNIPSLTRMEDGVQSKTIGGTPGLMLSLAGELAKAMGGSAILEEVASEESDLVSDGTVERIDGSMGEQRIALKLPKGYVSK